MFGELKRLEPMPTERKAMWKREVDWLLSVTDHIVEMVPEQRSIDGNSMEVRQHLFPSLLLSQILVAGMEFQRTGGRR